MTTTTPPHAGLEPARSARGDTAFRAASFLCGLAVLAILGLIAVSLTQKALPALREEGFGFLTSSRWAPNEGEFGALAFVYGTMIISAIALVFAVPVSIGIALFLTEVAPRRLRKVVSYLIDLLAAIPSVVYGLWGVLVLAAVIVDAYDAVGRVLSPVPLLGRLFEGPANGRSLFTAGLILALMITPIITAITREIFDTVPPGQKEAALALGATRWEMIRGAVFPHSRSGMVGAVMLGLGRAMGETIAAALVIGSSPRISAQLFGPGDALPSVIAFQFGEASGTYRSALIALGVVLFAMTIVVNVFARLIVNRGQEARAA